jgi:hypothetical protein
VSSIKSQVDGIIFELDVKSKVLTCTVTPELYWPMWQEYVRTAEEEKHDAKAQKAFRTIAFESERLHKEHGPFTIRLQTVHMGKNAMARAVASDQ